MMNPACAKDTEPRAGGPARAQLRGGSAHTRGEGSSCSIRTLPEPQCTIHVHRRLPGTPDTEQGTESAEPRDGRKVVGKSTGNKI